MAKKAAPAKASPSATLATFVAFVAGLALGLFVAFAVYLRGPVAPSLAGKDPAPSRVEAPAAPGSSQAPAAGGTAKPKFDFYTILPEMEVKVPEAQAARNEPAPAQPAAVAAYQLQVGSFQRMEEADRAKAQLALLGLSATIDKVQVNNRDTWYRVRLGPWTDASQMEQARQRLQEARIEYTLLRLKGAGTT
ncbi:MAG: SPOR domain-containing protein [Gammaproteobacteria bacterium]